MTAKGDRKRAEIARQRAERHAQTAEHVARWEAEAALRPTPAYTPPTRKRRFLWFVKDVADAASHFTP